MTHCWRHIERFFKKLRLSKQISAWLNWYGLVMPTFGCQHRIGFTRNRNASTVGVSRARNSVKNLSAGKKEKRGQDRIKPTPDMDRGGHSGLVQPFS